MRTIEGEEVHPPSTPGSSLCGPEWSTLLCSAAEGGGEKTASRAPVEKESVMELAHAHPMAGHLGAQNTIQRICDRFHWPGLDGDVKRFCQACPHANKLRPGLLPPAH